MGEIQENRLKDRGYVEVTACNWGRNMRYQYVQSVGSYSIVVRLGVQQSANIQSTVSDP